MFYLFVMFVNRPQRYEKKMKKATFLAKIFDFYEKMGEKRV